MSNIYKICILCLKSGLLERYDTDLLLLIKNIACNFFLCQIILLLTWLKKYLQQCTIQICSCNLICFLFIVHLHLILRCSLFNVHMLVMLRSSLFKVHWHVTLRWSLCHCLMYMSFWYVPTQCTHTVVLRWSLFHVHKHAILRCSLFNVHIQDVPYKTILHLH